MTAVDINYATRRARVRWDDTRVKLSDILAAIAAIGYRAYPYDAAKNEEISRKERRDALWRLWVAGFGMMQVMMYALPVYLAEGDMTADIESLMRWASLLLTLPVVFYSSSPFFRNAWRDLKLRRVGMDVPVALGVGAAFVASCWATLTGRGEVYFDSVTMFVFFLLGGRFLEMTARQKAVSVTEALAKLLPAFAQIMPNFPVDRSTEQRVVADLHPGDVVLVRPGDIVPADGKVIEGASSANEALLTGESRLVQKTPGSPVTGGSLNAESPLVVRIEQVGEGTRLSAIIHLMERAATEKPRIVELADRIASYFVAALLVVAIAVAIGWYSGQPVEGLVDHGFGAGRHLPLRAVAGDADRVDRGGRRTGQGWSAGDARARHRDAGAGDAFRFRQDRHADQRPDAPRRPAADRRLVARRVPAHCGGPRTGFRASGGPRLAGRRRRA